MNTVDIIKTALTPGSPFNRNELIFRSVQTLAQFANLEEDEVLEVLTGDLGEEVTCRPAKNGGILAALNQYVPEPNQAGPISLMGGNLFQKEVKGTVEYMDEEGMKEANEPPVMD